MGDSWTIHIIIGIFIWHLPNYRRQDIYFCLSIWNSFNIHSLDTFFSEDTLYCYISLFSWHFLSSPYVKFVLLHNYPTYNKVRSKIIYVICDLRYNFVNSFHVSHLRLWDMWQQLPRWRLLNKQMLWNKSNKSGSESQWFSTNCYRQLIRNYPNKVASRFE